MKRIAQLGLLIAALAWCCPAVFATITHIQSTCATATACSSCALTVTSTTAGNLGSAIMLNDGGGGDTTISSVSDGTSTYTHCSACHATVSSKSADEAHTFNLAGGKTTITFTLSRLDSYQLCFIEESSSLGTWALDAGATPACASTRSTQTPTTCNLTISGTTDVVIAAQEWSGTLTGVTTYTDFKAQNGNGTADHLNTSSGTGAAFSPTTNGTGANFTIAFTESAAGGATTIGLDKRRRYEQVDE